MSGPRTRRTARPDADSARGRLGAVTLAAVVLLASGCSTATAGPLAHHDARTTGTDHSQGSRSATPETVTIATSTDPSVGPRVRESYRVTTRAALGPIALGDEGRIAVPMASAAGSDAWTRVGVASPSSREMRVVAQSRWRHGLINHVALTGRWLVWVDQSRAQGNGASAVRWRVDALDLRTERHRVLDTSGRRREAQVPEVRAQAGSFFWALPDAGRTARVRVWPAGASSVEDGPRGLALRDMPSLADGAWVYLGPPSQPQPGQALGGDCWSVPLGGGTLTPLTTSGLALGCAAAGTSLVWSRHIDPAVDQVPPDGVLDDPWQLIGQSLMPGDPSFVVHTGYLQQSRPLAAGAATAWLQGRSVRVARIAGAPTRVRPLGPPSDLTINGGHLAWVVDRGARTTVQVARYR